MLRHGCGRSPGAQDGFEPTIVLRLQRLTERSLRRLHVSLVTQIVIRAVHSFDWTRSQHEPSELASKQARCHSALATRNPRVTANLRENQNGKDASAAEDTPRFAVVTAKRVPLTPSFRLTVAAAPTVRHLSKPHLLRGR